MAREYVSRLLSAAPGIMWAGLSVVLIKGACNIANANVIDLTFNYTVLQGTCELNVPSTLTFTGATQGATNAIGKPWFFVNPQVLNVSLTNCIGKGAAGTRPAIQLQGISPTDGSAGRKSKIFTTADATKNTTGFGVVFSTAALTSGSATGLISNNDYAYIGAVNAAATNKSYPLNVALACGEASDCAAAKIKPGHGEASVQFTFTYH